VQVSDLGFNWLAINQASMDEFERIFGRRPAVGLNMLTLLDDMPEHQEAVRKVWQRALDGEEFTEVQEFGESSRDRRTYEMHFRPLHDAQGRRIGAYQFVYDVTERRRNEQRLAQAEAALHQAQKMEAIGQLTGGIAHDFNNLLQAVRNSFELLRRKPDDVELVRRFAERGIETTKRAARLTNQLLTFSRQQSLDIRPVLIRELLAGMTELMRTTLGSQVSFFVEDVPEDEWVYADATQLEMALLNLGINARDAMPAGGTLRVFTRESAWRPHGSAASGFVDLCVKDSGLGMSEEVRARAFDPFFTTKEIGKGSGLGLSQVYAMASRAGGTARIESIPGMGTTVVLSLPRAAPVQPPEAAEVGDRRRQAGIRGTILVIDDDADVRQGLVAELRSLGHEVLEAGDGEEGLALLDRQEVDALLLDFAMPGMTGAQVAHLARSQRPDLGIVFMSGYSDTEAIAAAVGQDAVLLRKPFDLDALHHGLQRTMLRRQAAGD
jgi:PAS domain S-box-containing protein